MMEYADNLKQLYINLNNVRTLKYQKEGADFYVPLYEKRLRKLKVALMLDTDTQDCFYIYGQPGSGKSTALNYFDDDALRQSYEIILIKGRCLFDLRCDCFDAEKLTYSIYPAMLLYRDYIFDRGLKHFYLGDARFIESATLYLPDGRRPVPRGG